MKQAVIVIHGIGEQRPMDTLRGFAESVLPDDHPSGKPKFWSKPDRMSDTFELRKLTIPQTKDRPPTDLYEFYWAYHSQGTKFQHILTWAKTLLFRLPKNVPEHLRFLWFLLWFLILALLGLTANGQWARSKGALESANTSTFVSYGVAVVFALLSGFVIAYVGDAARYLNPSPTNIELRRKIRSDAVSLLRKLHESKEYSRIIVVGHSLGSVVGYDMLRYAWVEFNTRYDKVQEHKQDQLEALEKSGKSMERPDAFRQKQVALWKEMRELRNPWLVTDFITLGSPLAHASLLLAESEDELDKRKAERELPTCPPEEDNGSYSYVREYKVEDQVISLRALHHAALFGCTRWTNIYFPALLGFFGDLVGGPLQPWLGQGIKDIAAYSPELGGLLRFTPVIHTHYWSRVASISGKSNRIIALESLRNALDLDSRPWLSKVRVP